MPPLTLDCIQGSGGLQTTGKPRYQQALATSFSRIWTTGSSQNPLACARCPTESNQKTYAKSYNTPGRPANHADLQSSRLPPVPRMIVFAGNQAPSVLFRITGQLTGGFGILEGDTGERWRSKEA